MLTSVHYDTWLAIGYILPQRDHSKAFPGPILYIGKFLQKSPEPHKHYTKVDERFHPYDHKASILRLVIIHTYIVTLMFIQTSKLLLQIIFCKGNGKRDQNIHGLNGFGRIVRLCVG